MSYKEVRNFYCPQCMCTRKFIEELEYWICEMCGKRLWKRGAKREAHG